MSSAETASPVHENSSQVLPTWTRPPSSLTLKLVAKTPSTRPVPARPRARFANGEMWVAAASTFAYSIPRLAA